MTPDEQKIVSALRRIVDRRPGHRVLSDPDYLTGDVPALGLDSIEKLDFAMALEAAFNAAFSDDTVLGCRTVSDIAAFIRQSAAVGG